MIIKTADLTPQGKAARNRAITRLRAAIAADDAARAKYANWVYRQGSVADLAQRAAANELTNARAPFTPQFGRYELPEDLAAVSIVKGLA